MWIPKGSCIIYAHRTDWPFFALPSFFFFDNVSSRFWDSLGMKLVATNSKDPSTLWVFIHRDYFNPTNISIS